jgi:hypothetical protein
MRAATVLPALLVAAAFLAIPGLAPAAHTQEYRLSITPYVWVAGMNGKFAVNSSLPTVDVEADFDEIIEETQLAFAGKMEASDGVFHLIADLTYADLGVAAVTEGPIVQAASFAAEAFVGNVAGGVRLTDMTGYSLDVLSGIRYTWTKTSIALDTVGGSATAGGQDKNWGDLFVGARGEVAMTEQWFLSAYGDIGAGESDYTWQLFGAVNYSLNRNTVLFGGYRAYEDKYDNDGYIYRVRQEGPILGATIFF